MKENKKGGERLPLASAAGASSATPSAGHIPATPLSKTFERFYDTVKAVRAGCPWDKEQTPLSLRSTFFEETCEAIDAITCEDSAHVKEELGDVLLNVILISHIFEEKGLFTVEESINAITEKLIRRHPHVFKDSEGKIEVQQEVKKAEEVSGQWERIKENVEGRKGESVLDSVPEGFPPLLKAYKLLKKAAKKDFEWNSLSEVQMKFCEELGELKTALSDVESARKFSEEKAFVNGNQNHDLKEAQLHLEEEFGDVLLSLVNYGRWLNIDPSIAMEKACKKFRHRFSHIEKRMTELNIPFDAEHRRQMMEFWCEAKKI